MWDLTLERRRAYTLHMAEPVRYDVTASDILWAIDGAVLDCREQLHLENHEWRSAELESYVKALSALREQLRSEKFRVECSRIHAQRSLPPMPILYPLRDS